MIKSRICEILGIEYPIIQGGMAWVADAELAAAVSAIYRECTGEFATEGDTKNVRSLITYAKNMMLSAEEISELDGEGMPFSQIYEKYNTMLKEQRFMDYDDQMVYAYTILKKYPAILARVSARYRYV